jgi:hypothetical protein
MLPSPENHHACTAASALFVRTNTAATPTTYTSVAGIGICSRLGSLTTAPAATESAMACSGIASAWATTTT